MSNYRPPDSDGLSIPESFVTAFRDYFDPNEGVYKRACLTHSSRAILENNLEEAMNRADNATLRAMPQIMMYLRRFNNRDAWGSHEKVEAWLKKCAQAHKEARADG